MQTQPTKRLVNAQECLNTVFPCEISQPSLRTFRKWQSDGLLPYHKIGRLTFFDPEQVFAALERRCKINALPAPQFKIRL